MGVLADQMKAVIDQMKEVNEREARATREFVAKALDHCDRMKAALDELDDDDPKAAAIELLRAEGWELIPPRN